MMRAITGVKSSVLAAVFVLSGTISLHAQSFEAEHVSFQNITGAVEIVTTQGGMVDVEIRQGEKEQSLTVAEKDGIVTIAAPQPEPLLDDCCNSRIQREVDLRRDRKITNTNETDKDFFADYPTIIVSMPMKGDVEFVDARMMLSMERLDGALTLEGCYVYGETGDLGEASIGLVNGSRLVVGNVGAGLEIDLSGRADIKTGDIAMVDVDIAGAGQAILGDVEGILDASIAGSGVVRAGRVVGPVTARIAGSGAVAVKEGRADPLKAMIDGSGTVYFGGAAHQPELRLSGSSEVRVADMTGRVKRSGRGAFFIGDQEQASN